MLTVINFKSITIYNTFKDEFNHYYNTEHVDEEFLERQKIYLPLLEKIENNKEEIHVNKEELLLIFDFTDYILNCFDEKENKPIVKDILQLLTVL